MALLGINLEAGLLIGGQRGGMVQRAGVEPQPVDLARPGDVHYGIEKVGAEAAADVVAYQAEIGEVQLLRMLIGGRRASSSAKPAGTPPT